MLTPKVFLHTRWRSLNAAGVAEHRAFEFRLIACRNAALNRALQVAIKALTEIEFRRVRRQVEYFEGVSGFPCDSGGIIY